MWFQVCSPKELVVGLLEQVEEADADAVAETITLLLMPLQTGEELSHWTSRLLCLMQSVEKKVNGTTQKL